MKIRVIVPFMDKAFNDTITRQVGDIIDTDDAGFKCSEELAMERVKRGFCEVIEEIVEEVKETEVVIDDVNKNFGPIEKKPAKKGKKASKKR